MYDKIITQNEVNVDIYKNYISDLNKIIISPLPDYKFINKKILTSNINIVIGIIGEIHSKKGKEYVEHFIEYYKYNDNIKVVIFGTMQGYNNAYSWNTIIDLNELFIKYKPNMIIETSIWPETYSYTLTIMKLTNLPIIYIDKKHKSVIETRLSDYNKAYKVTNIYELYDLIPKIKQDYFYTILPELYYPIYMSEYFNYNQTIFKNNVKPFFIYFPQFHTFLENNKAYYENFSDIQNLYLLTKFNSQINILI